MQFFPRKYKYRCIRVYGWFKDDKYVIWMWIWLILKHISLLDRIWSLWLVRLAHSPTNFIFWLGRLKFSVSINSHPDNIYLLHLVYLIDKLSLSNIMYVFCEIKESSLSDTRCLIQYVVSPQCGDKRMVQRCTRFSVQNYFVMTSYHWNARENTSM